MLLRAMLAALAAQAATAPPPPAAAPPTVAVPAQPALAALIAARSDEYFSLFFDGCDPARLRAMVTTDFEMYHDRGGVRARSAEPFVARYRERCRKSAAGGPRTRRALVPGSLHVDPVPGFGAIEEGRHDFYRVEAGKPEQRVETARYLHLWALTPEGWRLSRVFSYAHRPVEQGSPAR